MYRETDNYRIYNGDCLEVLDHIPAGSVDMVFADPPYRLSNDGITCKSGRFASVNKGSWDRSEGLEQDALFAREWLRRAKRVLSPAGTLWVSGTYHSIYVVAFLMAELGYSTINDIVWFKPNAPPNMSRRCFTASHETLLWAKKERPAKHVFNYGAVREMNEGKQMRSVWTIPATPKSEKRLGYHPTQKPLALLERCIIASTTEDAVVLDPFCGSGTTGVAAIMTGRRFIGIELDAAYYDLAVRRLDECQRLRSKGF